MSDKIVKDSNDVPLKRGDFIWNLNEGFISADRKGLVVEIINENQLRYSPEGQPCSIMNESPWLVQKITDSSQGYRNDYREECDRIRKIANEIDKQNEPWPNDENGWITMAQCAELLKAKS